MIHANAFFVVTAALTLLLGTWIFVTGMRDERKVKRYLRELEAQKRVHEAIEIVRDVHRELSDRDSLN